MKLSKSIALVAFAFAHSPRLLFAPDTGAPSGGGGGGEGLTLKQQLEAAQKDAKDAKDSLSNITSERDNLKTQLGTINGEVADLKAQLGTVKKERDDAKAEAARLTGEAKDSDTKAREIASGMGTPPAPKHESAAKTNADGKAHYDAYQAAQKAGDGGKAADIWAAHKKDIEAYVATLDEK
jgi:uncharacterized protein (DUF3084 family)